MLALTSPVETWAHRIPPGPKLAALAVFSLAVFFVEDPVLMLLPLGFAAAGFAALGPVAARAGLRAIRPLWIFVAVLLVWHGATGELDRGLALSGRIVAAVAMATLVTMTTRLDDLMAFLTRALAPLRRLGLDPQVAVFAMALVIRFTPVLLARGRALREAWAARSPRRPTWRLVTPMAVAALDDAEHVAEAIRARGGLGSPQNEQET
ncbi:energy-coupling factor transporter transmembrane component T family protein [Roseivivax isoporae]|uniref:ABC transporter permease n=1 Tax=Roseivivax isoporae LMG 25204 TaxID=1449351 RepID=X7F7N2_9RHOB|nr:energy-coupling factor transporter transmembrane protein EcfT [Roseivivax isoporae]ETX28932.1 ABC transporter permease [Roseivivax isoporae LMG 25204]